MSTYLFGDTVVHKTDPDFQEKLGTAYLAKARPLCCCRDRSGGDARGRKGLEMYIVYLDGRHYLKRMPENGPNHHPGCISYEPPVELSGLGELVGATIVENAAQGSTTLKLDFPLSKAAASSAPPPEAGDAGSARTDGSKLTLRALLHYLWEQAGFSRWSPPMSGKRNWTVIHKYLLRAAEHKQAKGKALADLLYVPEPYTPGQKNQIAQRRAARMSLATQSESHSGPRQHMLMVAEVKEIMPSRSGHKLLVKQMPDYFFMMNDDLHRRLLQRFEVELSLWDAMPAAHLLVAATFGVNRAGIAVLDEIALMAATENWIPFENGNDKTLLDELTRTGRRFVKGMRYNLLPMHPLAAVVLTDTLPPTALYIHPPCAEDGYVRTLNDLVQDSRMPSWIWQPATSAMPPSPADSITAAPAHNPLAPPSSGWSRPCARGAPPHGAARPPSVTAAVHTTTHNPRTPRRR